MSAPLRLEVARRPIDYGWAPRYLLRLDTLTGVLTIAAMWLVGDKNPWGWVVGLVNQALWIALIHRRRLWGLAPLTVALTALYTVNLVRWWWP